MDHQAASDSVRENAKSSATAISLSLTLSLCNLRPGVRCAAPRKRTTSDHTLFFRALFKLSVQEVTAAADNLARARVPSYDAYIKSTRKPRRRMRARDTHFPV